MTDKSKKRRRVRSCCRWEDSANAENRRSGGMRLRFGGFVPQPKRASANDRRLDRQARKAKGCSRPRETRARSPLDSLAAPAYAELHASACSSSDRARMRRGWVASTEAFHSERVLFVRGEGETSTQVIRTLVKRVTLEAVMCQQCVSEEKGCSSTESWMSLTESIASKRHVPKYIQPSRLNRPAVPLYSRGMCRLMLTQQLQLPSAIAMPYSMPIYSKIPEPALEALKAHPVVENVSTNSSQAPACPANTPKADAPQHSIYSHT